MALKKHVFPVFRSPRQDFVGEGLQLTLRSDSRGRLILLFSFLGAESYLVPVSCRWIEAWKGVVRPAAGISILEPSVGSRKTCGVRLCLVSFVRCGGVFSIISPPTDRREGLTLQPRLQVSWLC